MHSWRYHRPAAVPVTRGRSQPVYESLGNKGTGWGGRAQGDIGLEPSARASAAPPPVSAGAGAYRRGRKDGVFAPPRRCVIIEARGKQERRSGWASAVGIHIYILSPKIKTVSV